MGYGVGASHIHTRLCGIILHVINLNRVEKELLIEELTATIEEESGLFIELGLKIEPIKDAADWPIWAELEYQNFLTAFSAQERHFIGYGYIEISALRWYAQEVDKFVATRFMCGGSDFPWRILDEKILEPLENTASSSDQANGNTTAEHQ